MIKQPRLLATMLAAVLLLSFRPQPENDRVINYINQFKDLAVAEMLRTGVPASITLAQGILETAGGQSDLASQAFNHFGIKCKDEWKGETMFHDDDAKGECFRKYPSVEDSYKDHSDFLAKRPHYAFLFKLDPTDYEGWAKGLKKAGYATNPQYAQRLIKIIVENNLQQYTLLALNLKQTRETELFALDKPAPQVEAKTNPTKEQPIVSSVKKTEEVAVPTVKTETKISASNPIVAIKKPEYPVGKIFTINGTKVIYAEAGASLFAIANNFNVAYKKLLEFNHLNEIDILNAGQLVFVEKKPKKGENDFHIIEASESLQLISQKEGIQLSSILEYNHLRPGMEPAIGEKLYLKAAAPNMPKLAVTSGNNRTANMK